MAQAVETASWWRPDLITADLRLPDGSGCEAARMIREHAGEAGIVTVLITAHPELRIHEPGVVTLTKPFNNAERDRAIETALRCACVNRLWIPARDEQWLR